jgi:hypothetical protein
VRIDREGCERALANVLDNALPHTPSGGTIDGNGTEGAYVRVVDGGPGLAPDRFRAYSSRPSAPKETATVTPGAQAWDSPSRPAYSKIKAARSKRQTYPIGARSSRSAFPFALRLGPAV